MFEKEHTWGQSIVLSETVLEIIVGKGTHLRAVYCFEWKSIKIYCWKQWKFEMTHVSPIPGLLTSWDGLKVDYKWIIGGL